MTPTDLTERGEAGGDERTSRVELVAAVLLGVAGVLTALCAYRAALADGDALAGYTESTQLLADANQFYNQSLQEHVNDQQLFTQFATQATAGNGQVATYILERLMSDNLRGAVEWWEANEDADTPFDEADDNPYETADLGEAQRLEDRSAERHAEGAEADEVGDRYEQAAVLFALTLFFGGIATLLRTRLLTRTMLVAGSLFLVAGGGVLGTAL